jgi:hypothetical protein
VEDDEDARAHHDQAHQDDGAGPEDLAHDFNSEAASR